MWRKLFSFLALFAAHTTVVRAQEACSSSYVCTAAGCQKVRQCAPPSAGGVVLTPSTPGASYRPVTTGGLVAAPVIGNLSSSAPGLVPMARGSCAENGSCYGDISGTTGRPKTVGVQGYYRRDGTYVRGYYRSRRN